MIEYYQLEELEDRDSCTTELYLRGDGGVEFGDTDGPQYDAAAGSWSVPYGTNDFSMTIKRTFTSGRKGTDMVRTLVHELSPYYSQNALIYLTN